MEGWLIRGSDGIVASEISIGFKNNSLTYKQGKRARDLFVTET